MCKPSIGITPEGVPSIALSAFAALLSAVCGYPLLAFIFFLLTFFCCNFFRDPERVTPTAAGLVISPADGKIIKITDMADPFTGEKRLCICVFMNVFNVHVNRSPVSGTVNGIAYHEGKFINASFDKASSDNERCAYRLRDENGDEFTMVQIAGLVARRIVCRINEGERLERGERFGMIKFGSRVDVYLPEGYVPKVNIGQKVLAGQSILAEKTAFEERSDSAR